jgi:type IV pilus assembly protein PilE
MMNKKKQGFTLIEVIITMAIVAILTTIAVPTYQSSVRKSRRIEAIATLLDIQLRQEKWRANKPAYGSLEEIYHCEGKSNCPQFNNLYYDFDIPEHTTTTYQIEAKAKEGADQVNDKAQGTVCSPLTLNQSGEKGPDPVCWR